MQSKSNMLSLGYAKMAWPIKSPNRPPIGFSNPKITRDFEDEEEQENQSFNFKSSHFLQREFQLE